MDELSGLLNGPRADGAFLLRSVLAPPWSIGVRDEAPLSIAVVVEGSAWVLAAGTDPVQLCPGDVMIARGPDPYVVADDPGTPPQVFIDPGQHCVDAEGRSVEADMVLGPRTWGNDAAGPTVLVTGTYETTRAVGDRLLRALPTVLVVPAAAWDGRLVGVLCDEMVRTDEGRTGLGREVYLDRLLDLVLIDAVRAWLAADPSRAPRWHRAADDPVAGPALRLMEDDLARPWTVSTLAREVGVSRSGLARRFTSAVGEPPMTYLTTRRLDLAADLLADHRLTLAAVAHRVGYSSPFALSAAFTRVRGVSPSQHRRTASSATP